MKYDVTIGIPVYEAETYIFRSLESALSQTYTSIEFLIIDDGCSDASMDIIRFFQAQHPCGKAIRIISHEHNKGVSAARNRIIDEAAGEYLYFMDADDVIADNTISLLMAGIRRYEAEIVFGSYEKINTDDRREVYQYPNQQLLGEDQLASFAYRKYAGIQASACNYLVKTSLLRTHKLHFIHVNYWEDLVFTFNLVTFVSRAVMLSEITYTYYCHDHSLSHYQQRDHISKDEIFNNVRAIDYLKESSSILYNKVYYPNRCFNIMMTDFYIVCNILKRRKDIVPVVTDGEIKTMMTHPASFRQICAFRQSRYKNMAFYLLGHVPAFLCVTVIRMVGKMKKLI